LKYIFCGSQAFGTETVMIALDGGVCPAEEDDDEDLFQNLKERRISMSYNAWSNIKGE